MILSRHVSSADTHFSNETRQVQGPGTLRLSADEPRSLFSLFTGRDVTAWKNACPVGTRNYRSDTVAAATSRKICFPFHSIARRVYFTANHHRHHVERTNICQRYYDRATLYFLERSLSRTVTPANVLLKFLKLCVSDARRRLLRLFKFPRGSSGLRVVCFYGKKCWVRNKKWRTRQRCDVYTCIVTKRSLRHFEIIFQNYFDLILSALSRFHYLLDTFFYDNDARVILLIFWNIC